MTGLATLLDRLDCVKQTATGRWIARCPAHSDRSPSLSIRQLEDGRLLLHDFGGCETDNVLGAVGLSFSDLFPERLSIPHRAGIVGPSYSRIPARDLLEVISEETGVVVIVAADLLAGRPIDETDWQRLAKAAARIHRARDHAYGR